MTTPATPSEQILTIFIGLLLDTLTQLVPGTGDAAHATRRDFARILLETLKPGDALETMLAARAIASHFAAMDAYARAAKPGLTDEAVIRLRANAIAASRSFDAALRTLAKRQAPAVQPRAKSPQPEAPAQPARTAQHTDPARLSDALMRIPGWREATTPSRPRDAYRDTTALASTQVPAPAGLAAASATS